MKNKFFTGLATILAIYLSACSSSSNKPDDSVQIGVSLNEKDYAALISKHTQHDVQYESLYNKYELHATFLNSEVQTAILQKKSDVLKWSAQQAQTEREKIFQENSNQTKFALSLFTPSPRLNDLHKGSSIWRIYLESNGQRYEGKAARRNGKLEDIQAIFPYHNRWSIPYDVVFQVPLTSIEKGPVQFTITSTQGTTVFNYSN